MSANIPDEKQDSCSFSVSSERVRLRFDKAFYESEMLPFASESVQIYQCTGIKIKQYIQQVNNGSPSAFNNLVECNSKAVTYLIKALYSKKENLRIIVFMVKVAM